MEEYTGEDEPPCIVMTFKDNSDKTTPPDLSLPVTLTGVREPRERLRIHRPAEGNVGLVTLKCITIVLVLSYPTQLYIHLAIYLGFDMTNSTAEKFYISVCHKHTLP